MISANQYLNVFRVIQLMTAQVLENERFMKVVEKKSEQEALLYFQGEYLFSDIMTRWLTQHLAHDPKEVVHRIMNEGRFVSLVGIRVVQAVRKINMQHN